MIGYYVHHQGAGHLHRMSAITAHLDSEVVVLSSLAPPGTAEQAWVELARDDEGSDPVDVDARGTLHWVPRHDAGLGRRAGQIVGWLSEARPSLLVVDVSVEVALLARLCGVPVVVVAMPGSRSDRAHVLAYDLAEALLAPWPPEAPTGWPPHWTDKTSFVGAVSRFDGLARPSAPPGDAGRTAFLLWGAGGTRPADLEEVRTATPGWRWRGAGTGPPLAGHEVWQSLCQADVVVSHGGQNAVAEVAAARTPAVVVADPRPFAEQEHTLDQLDALDLAVTVPSWPSPTAWPQLLERAAAHDGQRWERWNPGDGGRRAAALLDGLADRLVPGSRP